MNIIFMGYVVPEETAERLSGASNAGNKMQLNLLKYLAPQVDNLTVTTIYPVSSFRTDGRLFYRRKEGKLINKINVIRISFINIVLLKQIIQIIGNYKEVKKLVKKRPDSILLTFNMYPQVGIPAIWIKKRYGCEIVSLLADLPIDDNYERRGIGKKIFEWFNKLTRNAIQQIDKAVVLNKYAWEKYAPQAKCLVMDGGIDIDEESEESLVGTIKKVRRNLLYSGSLNEYSGVRELVEAMAYVKDSSIELDIYGEGNLREYVMAKCNDRIHYYGKVSNKEMLDCQKRAWILINPRPVDDAIARVTFPSKIFEYLNSLTPVITTRLNGFTKEYNDLMLFAESNEPKELAATINMAGEMNEDVLENMAENARKFVRTKRTWKLQAYRIREFICREQTKDEI